MASKVLYNHHDYAAALRKVTTVCTDLRYLYALSDKIDNNDPAGVQTFLSAYKGRSFILKKDIRDTRRKAKKALDYFGIICLKCGVAPVTNNEEFLQSLTLEERSEEKLNHLNEIANQCVICKLIIPPAKF